MLGILMAYLFPFTIPTILFSFGVIHEKYEWILMFSPSHSSNHLITSSIIGNYDLLKIITSCIYLTLLSIILFNYFIYPKLKKNALRG